MMAASVFRKLNKAMSLKDFFAPPMLNQRILVSLHQGQISFISKLDEGSTFYLELPYKSNL